MARIKDVANVWNNIKQIDLRPLTEEAQAGVKLALVGRAGAGKHALADQLRRDPTRPSAQTQTPILLADLEIAQGMVDKIAAADLVILVLDGAQPAAIDPAERELAERWANSGTRVLVLLNQSGQGYGEALNGWVGWDRRSLAAGPLDDAQFLLNEFVPLVLDLLPEQLLALGRYYPLFRAPIAQRMISETCFSNAAYALSTGLAEVIPALNIPLNVTDMIVLSKNQAFLAYKLGLALGLSTRWQDYVTEFGGVLGGGFLWRQMARSLVGLIPAWGIIPKVAVAYAGTYVVGYTVLRWYQTGRHISASEMRQLYGQAFARGKNLARGLVSRVRLPRLRGRKQPALPAPQAVKLCSNCGGINASDAQFCQYCGKPLAEPAAGSEGVEGV